MSAEKERERERERETERERRRERGENTKMVVTTESSCERCIISLSHTGLT